MLNKCDATTKETYIKVIDTALNMYVQLLSTDFGFVLPLITIFMFAS